LTLLHESKSDGVVFGWSDWRIDGDDLLVVSCVRRGVREEVRAKLRDGLISLRVRRFCQRTPQSLRLWGLSLDAAQQHRDPSPE
jgi:hypothetical protein